MGLKRQQTYCLAATAQGQDEQTGASILSRPRIADHGTFVSVIDLCFFTRRRADHGAGLGCLVSTQPTNKALHRQIARSKAMLGHQILPDGHGIAARTQAELDGFPEWFAGRWRWSGFFRGGTAQPYAKPGDHLVGRFCGLAFSFPRSPERFSGLVLPFLAGDSAPDPVITFLAGFAGGRRPQALGGRTPMPAAFR